MAIDTQLRIGYNVIYIFIGEIMSLKALSDYTFYSRYSQYIPSQNRRETWEEAVSRVFDMHKIKYANKIEEHPELLELINFAELQQKKKRVLAAQRTLQFAIEPILHHELKTYNCTTTYIDRERVFSEMMYVLLCGCGAGFSVQKHHIKKIGNIKQINEKVSKEFVIEDSIEGWADAIAVLMDSYFENPVSFPEYNGVKVEFDFSKIRPEGSLIAGRFKAPGPNGLKNGLIKIETLLQNRIKSPEFKTDEFAGKLRPIDAYDLIMHISDCVLSGGVRRSATLCMFSHDDVNMINAKIGDWYVKNPQRARSNNSAALLKGHVTKKEFSKLMNSTKQFGEPGFIWVDNLDIIFNPCCEIGMVPKTIDGKSGWQGCNLTEINGKFCSSEENFLQACEASAIIGTLQAGYTNFKYLSGESKEIFEYESLLGCSITGWMDNPEILFDPKIQKKGAKLILEVNERVAKLLGINPCARATCVKPAGSTSCVLGTASGIHPHHARRYIRRTQVNRTEFCGQVFKEKNPLAVEKSVWSANGTDNVISFLCEVPQGSITKNQISAIELLEKVKLTQQNWVEYGTVVERCIIPELRHNVSNTITVKPDEWDNVEKFIFDNQKWFAGISLLPSSGDLDYPQAPFSTILTPREIVQEYGDASVLASGLIVDGLSAFDNNLWNACDAVLGFSMDLDSEPVKAVYPNKRNNKQLAEYFIQKEIYDEWFAKVDWVRRVKQFAYRYFNYNWDKDKELQAKYKNICEEINKIDTVENYKEFKELKIRENNIKAEIYDNNNELKRATYCLKHVSLWKTWLDLKREYVDIEWINIKEDREEYVNADTLGSQACAGGKCELF